MPGLGAVLPMFIIVFAIAFFISVFITRWIFGIEKIISNLTRQTELLEYQQKIHVAQLHLLASIADKLGVPTQDINEVVSEFGVEYE